MSEQDWLDTPDAQWSVGMSALGDYDDSDDPDVDSAGDSDPGQDDESTDPSDGTSTADTTAGGTPDDSIDTAEPSPEANELPKERTRRFNPAVAGGFAMAAIVATLISITVAVASRHHDAPKPTAAPATGAVTKRAQAGPTTSAAAPSAVDAPLRFTATSDCDTLPGSTAAQVLADPASSVPFVCATTVPGQIVDLNLDQPYVITGWKITPGAVAKSTSTDVGDPWPRHRVPTRIQLIFNDRARTILPQDTGNVHGEAPLAIPNILASEVQVVVLETSRPPKTPAPKEAQPQPDGGFLGDLLGGSGSGSSTGPAEANTAGDDDGRPDPSDGTFAISGIELIGHKVI